jgi:hypothetical protein
MPKICFLTSRASSRTPTDTSILAVCTMGPWHGKEVTHILARWDIYILVAVDKFTKWIEATPVITQDSTTTINLIKSMIIHFGVPHIIITDNGTNFTSKKFKTYYESMGIKLNFTSVAHPHYCEKWLYGIRDTTHSDTSETMWKMPLQSCKGNTNVSTTPK